jgi:hypothetical protein
MNNTGTFPKGIAEETRITQVDKKAIAAYINSPTEDGFIVHAKPTKEIVEKLFQYGLHLEHHIERITKERDERKSRNEKDARLLKKWRERAMERTGRRFVR